MKIYAYMISVLAAFMVVGTQYGLDRHKMLTRKFLIRKLQRKVISNKVKPMQLKDFGSFLREIKKFEEMKATVAQFKQ